MQDWYCAEFSFIKWNNQTIDQVSSYLKSDDQIHNFNGSILSGTFLQRQ